MLEATLSDAIILKRLIDSIKELVTDANFECNEEGLRLQAMDNSHVALVAVKLTRDAFVSYRCDHPIPLGTNLTALTKVIKCAKDDDICKLKAGHEADLLSLTYQSKNSDRIAEYEIKLMDIDVEVLGIPDTEYDAKVIMPSGEFGRIVRDLNQLGESVKIDISKEGIRFAAEGDSANGSILLKQTEYARRLYAGESKKKKSSRKNGADEEDQKSGSGDNDDEDEDEATQVKKEANEDEMDGIEEHTNDSLKLFHEVEGEDEVKEELDDDEENEEEGSAKKRKKAQKAAKSSKRIKKEKDEEIESGGVYIEMSQHVALTFSLKYLVNFAKSSSLSDRVQLMLSHDVPLCVLYDFGPGAIQYYLAPKIGDE